MTNFQTIFKRNQLIFWIGLGLVIGGDFLPMRDMQFWEHIKISANLIQLLGFIFCLLPVWIWWKQKK